MTTNYAIHIKRPPEEQHQPEVFSLTIDHPRSPSAPDTPDKDSPIGVLMAHNRLFRRALQTDGVIFPDWSCQFTAWTTIPPRTKRLTPWSEIAATYKATSTSMERLKSLYKLTTNTECNLRGYIPMSSLKFRDKRRALKPLVTSGLIRIYDGGTFCSGDLIQINPAIVSARDWWCPMQQGAMSASYLAKTFYKLQRVNRVNREDKKNMQIGYADASVLEEQV